MDPILLEKIKPTICELSENTLDILNFFSQFFAVSFAILFGLLAIIVLLIIFKS